MVVMKVQLIVVQGKSEGRTISLSVPVFRIGRGETCHLRPNSERVSREHAELVVQGDSVTVRDLGSRNGTLVNGKALTQPLTLKDRDVVQVGPLSFMVSIRDEQTGGDEPGAGVEPGTVPPAELSRDTAAALSLAENASAASAMRGGETILIPAFFDSPGSPSGAAAADDANDDEYERHPIVDGDTVLDMPATGTAGSEAASASGPPPAARKMKVDPGSKRTSDAASEILRKMMERGRVSR
jgi:predicted component of type VI protein secretion system